MSFESSVTIPLREYESLKAAKAALESTEAFIRHNSYSGDYWTTSKDEWIKSLFNELAELSASKERFRLELVAFEEKYGKLKK